MNKPSIIVDTREKTPWSWENDDAFEAVIYKKLDGGDYSIAGLEDILVVERKATVDELFVNFTTNKERLKAEFERLEKHKFKIFVIEETCDDVFNPYKYFINKKKINKRSPRMPVAVVASALTNLMLEHNVHIIFGGSRAQAMVRGILLRAWDLYQAGKL